MIVRNRWKGLPLEIGRYVIAVLGAKGPEEGLPGDDALLVDSTQKPFIAERYLISLQCINGQYAGEI